MFVCCRYLVASSGVTSSCPAGSNSNRPAIHTVRSPLPPDAQGQPAFFLRQMSVREEISRPFEFAVDLISKQPDIDANELLGESMTISIRVGESAEERDRHFNGIVSNFSYHGRSERYYHYRAALRPWFWFLSRAANCRIFQQVSVPDVFETVCRQTHDFSDFELSLTGDYKKWDYRVQYRESDFAFVSRLLEEEGIFYYFKHKEDKHILVLGDSNDAFVNVQGDPNIPYRPPGEGRVGREHISEWHVRHEVQSGKYVLDDYNFTKPRVDLENRAAATSRSHAKSDYEIYDYPGRYEETMEGENLAKIRLEELQTGHKCLDAFGDHRGLTAGGLFNLTEYYRESENAKYLITSAEITVTSVEIEQIEEDAENRFDVDFVALPFAETEPFRPSRLTPRPIVHGPQTAIVVGKEGEEIWTDKYGRVKLQFHWDREGESNENSSCWVRVSQVWSGKNWGGIQLPRTGQEVVVEFLEGDPDRPLVVGRVYNNDQMPPYELPNNQTQSGVISRSTKEGTPENFNELRFEDKKDEEEIYFHAEKDFNRVVENNDSLKVGFEKKDTGDQTIEVFNNQVVKIGCSDASDGSQTIEVYKDRSAELKTGNDETKVAQGNHALKIDAGTSTVEAAQSITLKVGSSTITIGPSSITIKAAQISIEGQASLDAKSGAMTTLEGTMTTVKGSGMAKIEGALVKIN